MAYAINRKPTRLTGQEAIEYAEAHGLLLRKYNDPIEDAREDLTPDEARKVAHEDPRLIYLDTPDTLEVCHIHGDQYEFRLGDAVAYGTAERDDEDGGLVSATLDHAPTQEWFDRIAAAIEATPDEEFDRLVLNAREVRK